MEVALEIEDLRVSLKTGFFKESKEILHGISLKVERGRIYAFLGPNGAGKTTTIKTILGLIPSYSGKISIMGTLIGDPDLRRRMGYAPESAYFPGYVTPREILKSLGTLSGLFPGPLAEVSKYWLDLLGLFEVIDQPIKTFSKGMKQRLALVQALQHDPEFLVLDEPATGLDPIGKNYVKNLMLKLKEQNKAVFISSHHLLDVQEFCDDLCILHEGRIMVEGPLNNLLPKDQSLEDFFIDLIGNSGGFGCQDNGGRA
jgi:ABC-2 type transport system ATP-binding protein